MQDPRSIEQKEMSKLVEFLDLELRRNNGWSITEEYPTTFTKNNCRNIFIIEEEDQLLSHAAIRYIILKTPQAVFKIAAIGSVVTSSEHRRKGYSHKILDLCVENARKEKADFAILWSDLHSFYEKLGFQMAGTEHSFLIDDFLPSSETDFIYREGANISAEALLKCYNRHTVTSARTVEDIRKYLKIPNSHVYTAWSKQNQLLAYAIEGKGADLKGYVHEWGGDVSKVVALLNYMRKDHKEPLNLICGSHSQGLIRHLHQIGVKSVEGSLGMIKLLNTDGLIQKVNRLARSLGQKDFLLERTIDDRFHLKVGNVSCEIQRESQLTQLLFGPIPPAFWSNFSASNQETLKKIFPLHLWVWGWDSV